MRRWKPERTTDKRAEDAKPDVKAGFTASDKKAKAGADNQVDEKELVPAE
jgi:hypothetical protein